MKKALLTSIAALFLATEAHAGMCDNYLCGKVEVQNCLSKPSNGKPWGYEVNIIIPLRSDTDPGPGTSGRFVGEPGANHKGVYYLKGKRYACKYVPQ